MSLHHLTVHVAEDKLEAEVQFMAAALGHVGFKEIMRPVAGVVGMGSKSPWYWLVSMKEDGSPVTEADVKGMKKHIAIGVENRKQVDEFHMAAVAIGARDNGQPGIREQYGPNYYGAFVISPAGINMEAVFNQVSEPS